MSCSIQLSMKFILLINIKMPTIVGVLPFLSIKMVDILTFMCRINMTSESFKVKIFSAFEYFCEQLKLHAQCIVHEKHVL